MEPGIINPPYLMVIEPRFWTANRLYRLYIVRRELVGVWAGYAKKTIPLGKKNRQRSMELDEYPFEQLRDGHKYNFALDAHEIKSVRLIKADFRFKSNHSKINQSGLLLVKPNRGKEVTFAVCTGFDVRTAINQLPDVLGSKLSIEIKTPAHDPYFEYSGKTVLSYCSSHGNQVEFLDLNGRCYLWYPGNRGVVAGRWRIDGECICFRYGSNTYNPVTDLQGGSWEPTPLEEWAADIIDAQSGDVCGLATGQIPYVLPPHPGFRSVLEAKHAD